MDLSQISNTTEIGVGRVFEGAAEPRGEGTAVIGIGMEHRRGKAASSVDTREDALARSPAGIAPILADGFAVSFGRYS